MKEIFKSKKKNTFTKRMSIFLLALLPIVFLCQCNVKRDEPDPVEPTPPPAKERQSGSYTKTIEYGGFQRTYIVHVPPGTPEDEKLPMVVVIHGANGTAQGMLESGDVNMRAKADSDGFIALYPEGTPNAEEANFSWNAVHCCDDAWDNGVDDIGFLDHLLDIVMDEHNVDDTRVYATGFSNGGMMSHRIGAELGHRFAAIVPVAGTIGGHPMPDQDRLIITNPVKPLAVMIIHGFLDTEVPYHGGSYGGAFRRWDISAQDSTIFWVTRNGCQTVPQIEDGDTIYLKETYHPQNGDTNIEVILYTMYQEGHNWPYSIGETRSSDVIWNFFKDKTSTN